MEYSLIRLCLRLWGRKVDVFLCGIRLILNHSVSGDIMLPGLAKVNDISKVEARI